MDEYDPMVEEKDRPKIDFRDPWPPPVMGERGWYIHPEHPVDYGRDIRHAVIVDLAVDTLVAAAAIVVYAAAVTVAAAVPAVVGWIWRRATR